MTPRPLYQCDCCDYFTLDLEMGWEVCPVCYWEEHGLGFADADVASDPNHKLTLRQARENFLRFGACEANLLEHVCPAEERQRYAHRPRVLD
jgi:hypothetical protein